MGNFHVNIYRCDRVWQDGEWVTDTNARIFQPDLSLGLAPVVLPSRKYADKAVDIIQAHLDTAYNNAAPGGDTIQSHYCAIVETTPGADTPASRPAYC